ncbi:MAG: hypothetical protein MRJ96_10985 [Nitrospirales bacterium]|nr:hypothetical protein [Nitrospira sp.]MDR4501964.1 hypothetical protein [Nitrospirales bacterium]
MRPTSKTLGNGSVLPENGQKISFSKAAAIFARGAYWLEPIQEPFDGLPSYSAQGMPVRIGIGQRSALDVSTGK